MKSNQTLWNYLNDSNLYPSKVDYKGGSPYSPHKTLSYIKKKNDILQNRINNNRKYIPSSRNFSLSGKVTKQKMLNIITSSYLIQQNSSGLFSTTPSAGALYPIEFFLLILNVEDISNGFYHFNRESASLSYLIEEDISFVPNINKFIKDAAFCVIMVTNLEGLLNKYGTRGYRYALLECGHVGQLLHLNAEKYGLVACPIGGYYDAVLEEKLQLQESFKPQYIYAFGEKNMKGITEN